MQARKYKVAEHLFEIRIEEPWSFMRYTPAVEERIRLAASGAPLPLEPVRAGDDVPPRTLVQHKEELPSGCDRFTLDLSQYEPFFIESDLAPAFTMSVKSSIPEELGKELEAFHNGRPSSLETIISFEEYLPWYYIYGYDGKTVFEFNSSGKEVEAVACFSNDFKTGEFYPSAKKGRSGARFNLSTALMIMFTGNTSGKETLLLHASVIRKSGKAFLFLGKSGTGKSTHSRLWLDNIEGCELINDDNPAVRIMDGAPMVFGTPWSGKTPCYRNVSAPIGGIVRIEQAGENEIKSIRGVEAYANVLSSASNIRWDTRLMDSLTKTVETVVSEVPSFVLKCLPNPEAALLCERTLSGDGKSES